MIWLVLRPMGQTPPLMDMGVAARTERKHGEVHPPTDFQSLSETAQSRRLISMARLCAICYQLCLTLGRDNIDSLPDGGEGGEDDTVTIHESWASLCASLDEECPLCWAFWRHIRAPSASFHQEEREGFRSWIIDNAPQYRPNVNYLSIWYEYIRQEKTNVPIWLTWAPSEAPGQAHLEEHIGSETTLNIIRGWLTECSTSHTRCLEREALLGKTTSNAAVPTRLLDLYDGQSRTWSLIETKRQSQEYSKYIALSHRWSDQTPKLLRDNYTSFQRGRPDEVLPRGYQDVITLCRALSVRYLWIDSLCIFQDMPEDFRREAATMINVYMNAFCTFSICCESGEAGLLRSRRPNTIARSLATDYDDDTDTCEAGPLDHAFVFDRDEWNIAVSNAPINRRGWVLQERLLSRRILYLGNDQLFWECDDLKACEVAPHGLPSRMKCRARKHLNADLDDLVRNVWPELVQEYMQNDLTFEEDRLIAFSGVARLMANRTGDDYMAGLWKSRLMFDLLWAPAQAVERWRMHRFDSERLASSPYRCPGDGVPSWSWAASPGPIDWGRTRYRGQFDEKELNEFVLPRLKPLALVKGSSLTPESDVFGTMNVELSHHISSQVTRDFGYGMAFYKPDLGHEGDGLRLKRSKADRENRTVALRFSRRYEADSSCYLLPLIDIDRAKADDKYLHVEGLVVQETGDGFVRIGSFVFSYSEYEFRLYGRILNAILDKAPRDGEVKFESSLYEYVEARKASLWGAEWATIHLV
ncbi:hypothetical protein NM208_g14793 [Fusarium decemcellulare]|uniref:Uncharacterized protein n=1 Tax=Fusarium decemcellulare TaxID=57161 RepID=A0ACC1RGR1_9HYPO|nr:hypothetical protein NM208_g14793 [Fusarium decemcellulare]